MRTEIEMPPNPDSEKDFEQANANFQRVLASVTSIGRRHQQNPSVQRALENAAARLEEAHGWLSKAVFVSGLDAGAAQEAGLKVMEGGDAPQG